MHTGAIAISAKIPNLIHIVINNGVHDSVGAQPTMASSLSLCRIAEGFKYRFVVKVSTIEDLKIKFEQALESNDNTFIEVICRSGARKDLGRPLTSPIQNKNAFLSGNLYG